MRTLKLTQVEEHKRQGTIQIEHLWSLFKPHEIIVLQTHAMPRVTRACAVLQKYWVDLDRGKWFIEVQCMSFDGHRFGPIRKRFSFPIFPGVVPIDSLEAYPLSSSQNEAAVREELKMRGLAFIKLCRDSQVGRDHASGCLRDYCGPVWVQKESYNTEGTEFFDVPKNTVWKRRMRFYRRVQGCSKADPVFHL